LNPRIQRNKYDRKDSLEIGELAQDQFKIIAESKAGRLPRQILIKIFMSIGIFYCLKMMTI